ncbi:MAG: AraC family transcriptional regulator [Clostridiales bacterium]|jgi:AraC-like DNA-binding protein|nr:AraC family transcriptional regulator [Clostridiales bacterium]
MVEKIVTILFPKFHKNYVFEGESHDFWELIYVEKGEVVCTREQTEIRLSQGNILFHKPGEFHKIRMAGSVVPQTMFITFVCKSAAMSFFNEKQFELTPECAGVVRNILAEAKKTFVMNDLNLCVQKLDLAEHANLGGQQMIRIYLEALLILSMRDQLKNTNRESFVNREILSRQIETLVTGLLKENLYEKLTLDDICKKINYGKTFLCVQFKKSTGRSIINYYIGLKIEESKKLLAAGKHTVQEIAYLLNFDTPAYFTAVFKRTTAVTPTEYRLSHVAASGR